jgi:hypothetical protein
VQCQKVNLHFIGLFDTMKSVSDGSYTLAIPAQFSYVAQAVALDEYRNLFPLESIVGSPATNNTRIEMGFLGSHSDMGGGFAEGDLAKVALVWMVNQAEAAGIAMKAVDNTIIANPVIHDKSNNQGQSPDRFTLDTLPTENRQVHYMNGTSTTETSMKGTGMTNPDTYTFITQKFGSDNAVGTVDMAAYLNWLNQNGYGINMTVQ